jgi:hypothetical protein
VFNHVGNSLAQVVRVQADGSHVYDDPRRMFSVRVITPCESVMSPPATGEPLDSLGPYLSLKAPVGSRLQRRHDADSDWADLFRMTEHGWLMVESGPSLAKARSLECSASARWRIARARRA